MNWFRSLGVEEMAFIGAFITFYALYIWRIVRISRFLETSLSSLIVKILLRTAYFSLLIIALLGPSFGNISREVKSIGKDIVIAVDLSESMNANDIQPSRLEKVKFELKNITNAFSSDRIGLIIFSSEAFVQCPLTYDQSAIHLFIETLHSGLVPKSGTDFGPPLQLALDKLLEDESTIAQPKSKTVVLISDGEDFGDDTEDVAQELEDNGIALFTLGVGTKGGSKIPVRHGFKKDQNGADVITKLDSRQLKSLAVKTGGKYFEINESVNEVEKLINTINDIEGQLRDARLMDVSANKYYYFLAIALALMFVDFLIHVKPIKI